MPYYFYNRSIITVKRDTRSNKWRTVIKTPDGNWVTLYTPAMPPVPKFDTAINNLHQWAKKKGLRKADCGCCWHWNTKGYCAKYKQELKLIEASNGSDYPPFLRCSDCVILGAE